VDTSGYNKMLATNSGRIDAGQRAMGVDEGVGTVMIFILLKPPPRKRQIGCGKRKLRLKLFLSSVSDVRGCYLVHSPSSFSL